MKTNTEQLQEIFSRARQCQSPTEREEYLAGACKDDPGLRQQVESLLLAYEQAGDFLGGTVKLPQSDVEIERAGVMIGRYKLLQKIGEGGFGVVYMAEQVEPMQRKVALKIIKAGMDTREVVARFEAERQALALMDHPNIAKVLDAGTTQAGRPYFVMELVNGIPITDYCDRENFPTTQRLRLFMKVCHAVQHAHQKGIIHRDLKPNNVLVTLHDGEPVPKVIDFGVAKALGQKLTEKTFFTAFHHMIGTPTYMSPEQAELSGLDIDTRSDIYSLGVLLYELLTGVTPLDADMLRRAALDEVRRMIRETEPPKPSTRLQTLGEKLPEVARRRRTEPMALRRLVRGDLDWIAMKCLEKDRGRRYDTASALVQDIERYCANEPVTAAAPSVVYRVRKFVRRHRTSLGLAVLIGGLLVAGVGVAALQMVRARQAENAKLLLASYMKSDIEKRILTTLEIEDKSERMRRFREFHQNMPAEAFDVLIALLDSPDAKIRRRAAHALNWFRDITPNRTDVFINHLLHDADPEVRLQCAGQLMRVETPEVDRAFVRATADSDEKVARLACMQTGGRGGAEGIGALFQALTNDSFEVRLQAGSSLIQLGVADERVVSTLKNFPPDVVKQFDKAGQDAAKLAEIMEVKASIESFADLLNKAESQAKARPGK